MHCANLLKKELLEKDAFLPTNDIKLTQHARQVLELSARLSLIVGDDQAFERAFLQLEPFYAEYASFFASSSRLIYFYG